MTVALQVLQPSSPIKCMKYSCTMVAERCVQRQQRRAHFKGESHGKPFRKMFVPMYLQYCASGVCEQGRAIAVALEGQVVTELPERVQAWRTRKKSAPVQLVPPPRAIADAIAAPPRPLEPARVGDPLAAPVAVAVRPPPGQNATSRHARDRAGADVHPTRCASSAELSARKSRSDSLASLSCDFSAPFWTRRC